MKRLRVYIGTPIRLTDKNKETFVESKITRPESNYTAIGDIADRNWLEGSSDLINRLELYSGQRKTCRAVATISKGNGKVRINNIPAEFGKHRWLKSWF